MHYWKLNYNKIGSEKTTIIYDIGTQRMKDSVFNLLNTVRFLKNDYFHFTKNGYQMLPQRYTECKWQS